MVVIPVTVSFPFPLLPTVYNYGVNSTTDPLWDKYYRDVYTAKGLDVPLYAVLGNHDYYFANPQAQIEFFRERLDNRWIMEDFYYTVKYSLGPGNNKTLQIVYIDTILLWHERLFFLSARDKLLGIGPKDEEAMRRVVQCKDEGKLSLNICTLLLILVNSSLTSRSSSRSSSSIRDSIILNVLHAGCERG